MMIYSSIDLFYISLSYSSKKRLECIAPALGLCQQEGKEGEDSREPLLDKDATTRANCPITSSDDDTAEEENLYSDRPLGVSDG